MAAREDQAQAIVLDVLIVAHNVGAGHILKTAGNALQRGVQTSPATNGVDALELASRNEPRPGIGRNPIARPLLEGRSERLLQRLLGEVEITEQTNQRRQDATRLAAINLLEEYLLDFLGDRLGDLG